MRQPCRGQPKACGIAAGRDIDTKFGVVFGLHIVLREAFPDLAGHAPNYMIGARVVIRPASEYFHSDGSLLEGSGFRNFDGPMHQEGKQIRTSLAVSESRTGQEAFELFTDCLLACLRRRQKSFAAPESGCGEPPPS